MQLACKTTSLAAHQPRFLARRARNAIVTVRAQYDVEVEPERRGAPDAGPGRWGGGAPPPPPPPPPPGVGKARVGGPNRRDLLIGLLGGGLGAAVTATYYNTAYDLSEDSWEKALDKLLDDPAFLDTVADEVLYNEYGRTLDGFEKDIESVQELDTELRKLKEDLEQLAKEE